MTKKTHVKVRLGNEAKHDRPFVNYVKTTAGNEKDTVKLN